MRFRCGTRKKNGLGERPAEGRGIKSRSGGRAFRKKRHLPLEGGGGGRKNEKKRESKREKVNFPDQTLLCPSMGNPKVLRWGGDLRGF